MNCSVCNVSLKSPSEIASHFTGKKHLKAVANVDLRLKQEGRAVYVTKLGKLSLTDIATFFATFGEVTNLGVGLDKKDPELLHHVIIEFANESSVGTVLRASRKKGGLTVPGGQLIGSQTVQVFERKFKDRRRSPSPTPCPALDSDVVKMRLSLIHSPEQQLEELVRLTYLSEEEVDERVKICQNLQDAFRDSGFPHCRVHPFGSSVNSLGFPGCDLDIYLDLGPDQTEGTEHVNETGKEEPVSQQQKVRTAAKLLRELPSCSRVHPILQARVPIVKFTDRDTGVQCDISFKNRLSVVNTAWIRLCVDSDPRVRSFLVALRYFAKVYGLAGGGGGGKLSSYALTLLGIVFLQVIEPPLLPTVATLQAVPDLPPDCVDGWNCSFASISELPKNCLSTLQLLRELFTWASKLDFDGMMLCPLLGRIIPKACLQMETFLHANYAGYPPFIGADGLATEKPLCLQDPFELTHNVCRNLPEKGVAMLKSHFGAASQVLEQLLSDKTEEGLVGGINALFGMKVEVENIELHPDKILESVLKGESEIVQKIFGNPHAKPVRLSIGNHDLESLVNTVLAKCLLLRVKPESAMSNEFLPKIDSDGSLKRGLSIDESAQKRQKQDGEISTEAELEVKRNNDGSTCDETEVSGDASSTFKQVGGQWVVDGPVWAGRKRKAALVAEEKVVAREAEITRLVMEEQVILPDPDVIFTCHALATGKGQAWIALHKVHSRKKAFESMVGWFNPYLADLVPRLVKDKESDVVCKD